MEPTLLLFNSPEISSHSQIPPVSPLVQMPNVFVVPPEEDQSPTWCCFDATGVSWPPSESTLSIPRNVTFNDDKLFHTEGEPACICNVESVSELQSALITPKQNTEIAIIPDVLIIKDYPNMTEDELFTAQGRVEHVPCERGCKDVGEDSEIVEVVKVRRHTSEEAQTAESVKKKSKSFKTRASRAFRSLRTKDPMQSKPRVQDIFTLTSVTEDTAPIRTPTVSRRGSIILSQLFNTPGTITSQPSVSSFEIPQNISSRPPEERPPSSTPYSYSSTVPQSLDDQCLCPAPSASPHQGSEYRGIRSPSPTSSTPTFHSRRRFSFIGLQRLFSFSSSPSVEISNLESTTQTSITTASRGSTGPSTTASSSEIETPNKISAPLPSSFQVKVHEGSDAACQKTQSTEVPVLDPGDTSFELRLDSLHFDSLSFDANRF